MAFKKRNIESNSFDSPQEMFQDNKRKKIKGLLDYQSEILDSYMKTLNGDKINSKNVAFELPTGSGKTLVGILIAEFQRRKHNRKCLFLCPTNQLVSQVCDQAGNQYGIEVIKFTGKQSDYSEADKKHFNSLRAVGVTSYSSFFAARSFFNNPDILIFDDVHSSEGYIADNWSLNINRKDHKVLFDQIALILKDVISESNYNRLTDDNLSGNEASTWNDLVPRPFLKEKAKDLRNLLQEKTRDSNLVYAWNRISDNLEDCQVYISWNSILIRPYIPPTETHQPFSNSSQRIFMSATLGSSGELERIIGCSGKIKRLDTVKSLDNKGIGRRFFVFPALGEDHYSEIITKFHSAAKRSVLIAPNDAAAEKISSMLKSSVEGIEIFKTDQLIASKEEYTNSENAVVIMSNRFDGVDFPGDESRMLFIYQLPKVTHLQDNFFVGKMAASLLYNERIKNRIVQAVGRCTRNANDYAVVCVLGGSISDEFTSPQKLRTYQPELRAEIEFGMENSEGVTNVDDFLSNINMFYDNAQEWKDAEENIVSLRDFYIEQGESSGDSMIFEKLSESALLEVKLQYDLWKKDYQNAYEEAVQIAELLNSPSVSGYKCYWQYVCGCLALELKNEKKAKEYFSSAMRNNRGQIKWFPDLIAKISDNSEVHNEEEDYFFDIVSSLEQSILEFKKESKFQNKVQEILDGLNSDDGKKFERAHLELGKILGYQAANKDDRGAPDPYWIINDDLCVVSEDKIYEKTSNSIPVNHVKQAGGHIKWIRENVKTLRSSAEIITVFVSNSSSIEEEARIFGKDLYYIHKEDLYKWAKQALNCLRSVRSQFSEVGDAAWREEARKQFKQSGASPKDFINLIKQKRLSEITNCFTVKKTRK